MQLGALARVQSGDHHAVTNVDAHVVVAVLEDDVAGLGVSGCTQFVLHSEGVGGQLHAVLCVNVGYEAGAVPCTEAAAAPNVAATDAGLSGCYNALVATGCGLHRSGGGGGAGVGGLLLTEARGECNILGLVLSLLRDRKSVV